MAESDGRQRNRGATAGSELKRPNYELFVVALTLLSLGNLAILLLPFAPDVKGVARTVDRYLSGFFLGDFVYRLVSAPRMRDYLVGQRGWLDFVGSLPFLGLRIARLYRVVRVLRLLGGYGVRYVVWGVLRDRAGSTLMGVIFLTVVVLEGAAMAVIYNERGNENANIHTASDALWWGYVTITTVGYGDRYPVTNAGRLVGTVLLTIGVGLYSVLTAFLAHAFVSVSGLPVRPGPARAGDPQDSRAALDEVRRLVAAQDATRAELLSRIDRLERLL